MANTPRRASELVTRTRWYIKLRWYLLLVICVPTFASLYLGTSLAGQRTRGLVIVLIALSSNLVFYILRRVHATHTYDKALAIAILAFDVLLISFFIYDKGGIESRSPILYAMPVLISALLFGRAGVYTTAAGSAALYDFVMGANYFGWIHSPEAMTQQASDGSYVLNTIIFFTAVIVLIGVLTDFLTRLLIQKEREARRTAAALRRAQAIAKIGSWEWEPRSDHMSWSEELCNLFGISPQLTAGNYQDFLRRIPTEERGWVEKLMRSSVKSAVPFSFDHRIVRPDKIVRIVHMEGKVAATRQGSATRLYGTAQDITDERALESAKGDFVSLASHQLRTPASGVRMLLAMLRDGYVGTLTPEQLRTVDEAYGANERMLRIADDLLNVAKLEAGRIKLNKQQIELCLWLKNSMAPQRLLAKEHRQRLSLVVPKGTVYLQADSERLAMVFDNLLSNARKYTPARGTITVTLQPGRRAHKIVVSDTGSGMSRAEVVRLFGKFTRLENPASRGTEGTGLGLYLAKSIVDLHGGSIRVRSKPGLGSTFTVTLPVDGQAKTTVASK